MNYLARLAQLETRQSPTDKTDKRTSVGFVSPLPVRIKTEPFDREAWEDRAAENDDTAGKATSEPLSNPVAEARRERALEKRLPSESAIELFEFTPPGDPPNDDEALQERAAIMAEANGWDDATALQEARLQADKERCWRGFLRNAARILAVPANKREGILGRYQDEAARRYGEGAGADMASSLESWVRARGVH